MNEKKGLMSGLNSRQKLMVNLGAGVVGLTALIWGGSAVVKSDFVTQPKENFAQYLGVKALDWNAEGYIENLNFKIEEGEMVGYESQLEQTAFVLNESDLLESDFREYLFTTNAEGVGIEKGLETCSPILQSASIEQQLDVYSGIMENATPEQQLEMVLGGIENVSSENYGSILKAMGNSIYEQVVDRITGGN